MKRKIKLGDGTVVEIDATAALPAGCVELSADPLDAKIEAAVEKALAPTIAALKAKATNNMGGVPEPERATPGVEVGDEAVKGSGINAVRFLKCLYDAKIQSGVKPVEIAKARGFGAVAKALEQSTLASGGVLVPEQFIAELIPFLRKANVFRAAGVREIPFVGSMELPRQTSSGTASWGAEGSVIAPSALGTGSVKLTEKELKIMTIVSNSLMQNASISADEIVRDDLAQTIGEAEEAAYLRGSGSSGEPMGLLARIAAANQYAAIASTAYAPTLAEVKKERAKARRILKDAKIPMVNPGYIMAPMTEEYLLGMTETTGATAFPEIEDGKWGRIPNYVTQQVPTNLAGGSGRSELYLVDFAQCFIGRSGGLVVEVFPNGTYEESGSTKSGINRNQTVIRGISKQDFAMRYELAGIVANTLAWGQTS